MEIDERIAEDLTKVSVNSSLQVRMGSENQFEVVASLLHPLTAGFGMRGIYISASRAASEIIEALEEIGIDTSPIHFIDCVSTSVVGGTSTDRPNISFIDSPVLLESIMLRTMYFQRSETESQMFVMLDAVHSLSIYNDERILAEYLHTFINTFRQRNALSVILTIPDQIPPHVLANLDLYCTDLIDRGEVVIS